MNTQTMDTKNTSIAAPNGKLAEDLRVVVDAEELLHTTANQVSEGVAAARARFQDSLQVVKERLVAAETAVIEHTRQAAKATDQYVHDNVWNWC